MRISDIGHNRCICRGYVLIYELCTLYTVTVAKLCNNGRIDPVFYRLSVYQHVCRLGRYCKRVFRPVPVAAENISGYRPYLIVANVYGICIRPVVRAMHGVFISYSTKDRPCAVSDALSVDDVCGVRRHVIHHAVDAHKTGKRCDYYGQNGEYEYAEAPKHIQHFL